MGLIKRPLKSFDKNINKCYFFIMISENNRLIDYIAQLQAQGQYSFVREQAVAALGVSDVSFLQAAQRLAKKRQLNRVRGEFYTIVPAQFNKQGSLPPHWFIEQLMVYLGQEYYVALLSAAALQGATHQLSSQFQVITNKVTPVIQTGKFHLDFLYKKNIKAHYYQKTKTAGGMVNVSIPEMTACDLLRYINSAGQINHVATVLCELGESLRPEVLAQLLEQGDIEVTVAQRLGFLLEKLGIPIDLALLLKVLKSKEPVRQPLVRSSTKPVIEHNKRWHILINETVEPDEL